MAEFQGWITFVGSRTITADQAQLLSDAACVQMTRGFGIRSGGAAGSDEAAHQGALRSPCFDPRRLAIYLPWNGFKRDDLPTIYHDPDQGIYDASRFPNFADAEAIALEARGSWEGLKQGGIKLHTRNAYQPLGHHLNNPSKSLVCCARPVGKKGAVDGGTNTAVQIALAWNIRVINIWKDEDRCAVEDLVRRYLRN
jgi:hypothetical protein